MSEQDGTQPATKPRRSRQTSKQNGIQTTMIQRPANDDKDAWKAYWKAQGQEWRTEPETDVERQKYLDERRKIEPNNEQGIYPFKDIKLSRADVEWLLATHENGRGPIDWSDKSQRERYGLDLRGADLREVFLAALPLAGMGRVKSEIGEVFQMTYRVERSDAATIHLEGTNFLNANLEGADLRKANLEGASLIEANLSGAAFGDANLKGARLWNSNLKEASLWAAHLEGANLSGAHLEGSDLKYAHLEGANIQNAFLDSLTLLDECTFGDTKFGAVALADVHWDDVNVAVVDWSTISVLGDEVEIKKSKNSFGREKQNYERIPDCQTAVRAYRQL